MALFRLTSHATAIFDQLVDITSISAKELFTILLKSEGLGSQLLNEAKGIVFEPTKKIVLTELVKEAHYQAAALAHSYVGTEHLVLGFLKLVASSDYAKVRKYLLGLNTFPKAVKTASKKTENLILETFGVNLGVKELDADTLDPLVPRQELNNIVSVLLKKDKANPLLIGEPGVGKRSLVKLLVRSMSTLDVPPLLLGYTVIDFDLMAFFSNLLTKGNIEFSLYSLQEELKNQKRVILHLKNFQNLFISTNVGIGIPSIYPMLREALLASGAKLIVSLSAAVYEKIISDNEHILEDFTVVEVPEPSEAMTKAMLKAKTTVFAHYHNLTIPDDVVEYIYQKSKAEIKDANFPQKGIELLDLSCSGVLVRKSKVPEAYKQLVHQSVDFFTNIDKSLQKGEYDQALKFEEKAKSAEKKLVALEKAIVGAKPHLVKKDDVDRALEDFDYISSSTNETDLKALSVLAVKVKKEIIGQDPAVDLVVKALIRSRLGLKYKKRPLGSFLFLGPTGVGKTELAKVLAAHVFGDTTQNHLIRLDMSDFSEKHTVSRLVGAPPGYVGFNEGGELTQKIEHQPDSVVLFDEIEKAHPDVLNILLQIMEEAELSDAKGHRYDFSRALIILTSNIGTEILHDSEIGFIGQIKNSSAKQIESHLKLNLKKILRPELLNRFDEVIVFRKLAQADQARILELMLSEFIELLQKQNVQVKILAKVKAFIIKTGWSDEYGARELRRTLEREVLDKVAEVLLKTKSRPLHLTLDLKNNAVHVQLG